MKVTWISCGAFANESERLAFAAIKQKLESLPGTDTWFLLTNLAHSSSARYQSDEIDQLLLGPQGVFCVEVKHWDRAWMKRNQQLVDDEAEKYALKVRRVATNARRRVPFLGRVPLRFLLTAEAKPIGSPARVSHRGVEFYTLKEIKELLDLDAPIQLSPAVVKDLCQQLEPRTCVNITGSLRRLGDFINLELQSQASDQPFHRTYRGCHARTKDKIILHLYDLSTELPGFDRNGAENLAAREFETMQRLQKSPCVPRFRDSLQDVQGFVGEMKFFTIVDPCAPSIEQRSADPDWSVDNRIEFTYKAAEALARLHGLSPDADETDARIIHRHLQPTNILVTARNQVLFTQFSLARIDGLSTVASAPIRGDNRFIAPELRQTGLASADERSDIFSFAASLLRVFDNLNDARADGCRILLQSALAEDPADRPPLSQLAEQVRALLQRLPPEETPLPIPAEREEVPLPRYWSEELVVRFNNKAFKIVSRLGSGGVGLTFKVVEIDPTTGENFGTYVGKVINEESAGLTALNAYRRVRPHTDYGGLSVIYETASEWHKDSFVALLKWVEGDSLSNLYGVLPLVAEESGDSSVEALVVRWAKDLCAALARLHRVGLVHGDVSPSNIIVYNGEVTLTDYDLVTPNETKAMGCGAVLFCSPEAERFQPLRFSDDVFALATSLYRAVTDRDPFSLKGVAFEKTAPIQWTPEETNDFPLLVDFVSHATSPVRDQRFSSATEALDWLRSKSPDTAGDKTPEMPLTPPRLLSPKEVPWLKSVLQLYPGSRYGNIETRGLDSAFAIDTYVETALEQSIFEDLIARRIRLLILCGNAGDGKTAFLQHLAKRFGISELTSAQRIWQSSTSDGLHLRANLDGAASFEGKSANALLEEFFAPFSNGKPADDVAHLLAINDGRLLEWIDQRQAGGGAAPLITDLTALLENQVAPTGSHIRLIDLNSRSLVGGLNHTTGSINQEFLDKLIAALLGGNNASEIWTPCQTCSTLSRCQPGRAAALLRNKDDTGRGLRIRERLGEALQAVHQRAEVHITARELRGVLSYILFGTFYCSDLHDLQDPPPGYWSLAFDPESSLRQGEVLRELTFLDPALEAHPMIDRRLGSTVATKGDAAPVYPQLSLANARRKAYFEWKPDEIKDVAGSSDALGLAHGRHLEEFKTAGLRSPAENCDLCSKICRGISRLEDLPRLALERGKKGKVALKVSPRTPTESIFWVEKSLDRFSLQPEIPSLESRFPILHRRLSLTYHYQDGRKEELSMGYELFHTLLELEAGFQLNDTTSDDLFANLVIFTQRLAQEGENNLFAWNPQDEITIFKVGTAKGPERQILACSIEQEKSE